MSRYRLAPTPAQEAALRGHCAHARYVWNELLVPKTGWVRFRWSRPVPDGVRSYRVTLDPAGRWHVAVAAIPGPIPAPGTGGIVGIDRGVAVSAALSTGEMLTAPRLSPHRRARLVRLQRRLARAKRGSNRRARTKRAIARLRAREADTRKDWAAGHAVTARGGAPPGGPANREPHLLPPSV